MNCNGCHNRKRCAKQKFTTCWVDLRTLMVNWKRYLEARHAAQ